MGGKKDDDVGNWMMNEREGFQGNVGELSPLFNIKF